eukprot:CAMPEP_0196591982 /NCGR_PEP_ID=MMETSP1081-20130531/71499_1 /TAXON_ID=36882 /ORGANISM="Pyramimonas amylifera, Strain CCMP720" /LENGTH=47 /DNA_ID= /DNA_START= /DNA_END= /DNA_ORIENTATION=
MAEITGKHHPDFGFSEAAVYTSCDSKFYEYLEFITGGPLGIDEWTLV